eukprot:736815_1
MSSVFCCVRSFCNDDLLIALSVSASRFNLFNAIQILTQKLYSLVMSQTINDLIDWIDSSNTNAYNHEEIIQFWFGDDNDDWTNNVRNKWFVPSNTKEQFDLDAYITTKYNTLLETLLNNTNNLLTKWKNGSFHSCLSAIIVLDQFSRHIYRKQLNQFPKGQRVIIDKCDAIALQLSQHLLSKHDAPNLLSTTCTVPQYIFCLMPYRHSKQQQHIEFVLNQINQQLNKNTISFNELITRFKRATMKQLQGIQSTNDEVQIDNTDNFDDILEYHGFDYNPQQEIKQENVDEKSTINASTKGKRKWKKRHKKNNDNETKNITNHKLYTTIKSYLYQRNAHQLKHVFVSLSGGVDSMVITKILYYLKQLEHDISFDIVAIHIDYGNRLESHKEALFLNQWCDKLSVIFRKRVISEIKRGVTKRDDYERISRDIRFDTYKTVLNEFECCDSSHGIIFGHHQGDVQENVISNMMKGCSLLNISGMDAQSVINGVCIWRPLLIHHKRDIFDCAHKFGVPYFKDTTPKWSSRGRMRNELLPLLMDIFGDGFLHNLSTLSAESIQFKKMAQKNIFEPCWNTIQYSECAAWIRCSGYENQSVLFWKETLKHVCEDILGIPRIHEKGIKRELMTKLAKKTTHKDTCVGWWLQLRREYKCYLTKDKILFVFVPEFAPILAGKIVKYNYYVQHGTELLLTFDKAYTFGVWSIQFVEERDMTHLEQDGDYRISFLDIASGSFYYFLPLLDEHGRYLIDKTKAVRKKLKCFRGLPHGTKEILPMVIAQGNMKKETRICVKVCVSFNRNAN